MSKKSTFQKVLFFTMDHRNDPNLKEIAKKKFKKEDLNKFLFECMLISSTKKEVIDMQEQHYKEIDLYRKHRKYI